MTSTEFETIFEAHKNAVYGFAWRMSGSAETAADIAQDCFLHLLRSPANYDGSRPVRPWLLGVARNLILKRWRSEGRWTTLDEDIALDPAPADFQASQRVAHAVGSLPPLQREVVILVEYEGLTLEQTAEAIGIETGAVKSRLHRARNNLRRVLAPLKESTP